MSGCCSASSREALTGITKLLVEQPEQVSAVCNGQGVTLSVAPVDVPRLTARNGQTLRALSRVHGAMCGDPTASVFL